MLWIAIALPRTIAGGIHCIGGVMSTQTRCEPRNKGRQIRERRWTSCKSTSVTGRKFVKVLYQSFCVHALAKFWLFIFFYSLEESSERLCKLYRLFEISFFTNLYFSNFRFFLSDITLQRQSYSYWSFSFVGCTLFLLPKSLFLLLLCIDIFDKSRKFFFEILQKQWYCYNPILFFDWMSLKSFPFFRLSFSILFLTVF